MIIGIDSISNQVFTSRASLTGLYSFSVNSGLIDHIYGDESFNLKDFDCNKPSEWRTTSIFNASLNKTLEAGSVTAGGMEIDKIKIQKRRADELEWEDVFIFDYTNDTKEKYFEFYDRYVRNDYIYQYCIVPLAGNVQGHRVLSQNVQAHFEGAFLTDINNNFHLFYDFEVSDIKHNKPSNVVELQNRQYPIVTYGQSNYVTFDVEAMYIANESLTSDRQVEIRLEDRGRNELIKFLQNGKPKLYRDMHGQLRLVTVLTETVEYMHPVHAGRGTVSFTVVEIGEVNFENLVRFNIYEVGGLYDNTISI